MIFLLRKFFYSIFYKINENLPRDREQTAVDYFILQGLIYFHRYSEGFISLKEAKRLFSFLRTHNKIEAIKVTNSGLVQLYSKDYLYFFGANRRASVIAKKNYQNYVKLSSLPDLKEMLAYEFCKEHCQGLPYYKTEKLQDISGEKGRQATFTLLEKLKINSQTLPLTDILDITSIVRTLEKNFKMDLNRVYSQFAGWELPACYMHGDPHFPNTMKNNQHNYVLIDLDRFKELGPAFYDLMFVRINILRNNRGKKINWVTFVIKKLQDPNFHHTDFPYSTKEITLFILLRIYLEDSSYLSPSRYLRYRRTLSLI